MLSIFGLSWLAGRSAAWLAHLPWEQGVGGSNPLAPTILPKPVADRREGARGQEALPGRRKVRRL